MCCFERVRQPLNVIGALGRFHRLSSGSRRLARLHQVAGCAPAFITLSASPRCCISSSAVPLLSSPLPPSPPFLLYSPGLPPSFFRMALPCLRPPSISFCFFRISFFVVVVIFVGLLIVRRSPLPCIREPICVSVTPFVPLLFAANNTAVRARGGVSIAPPIPHPPPPATRI